VWLHEPPYSSGTSNNILRLVLSPLFEHYGVDLVFSGHEHFYERTLPIHDFVPAGRGVVYLTVGGGGAGFTVFQKEDYCDFVEARLSYVTARIDGTRLTVEAHDPDGTVFDSVVLQKDSPAPARVRTRGVRRPR